MEYLITFEDGSSGYLAHYGVKGMKWGFHKKGNDVQGGGGLIDPEKLAKTADDLAFKAGYESETNAIRSQVKDYYPNAANNYAVHRKWMKTLEKHGANKDTLDFNKSEFKKERAKLSSQIAYNKAARTVKKLFDNKSSGVSGKIKNNR